MEKRQQSNKERFDSEPVYHEEYLKTKIKSYDGKVNTNKKNEKENENKIPKEGVHCVCFSIILIDSAFKIDKDYYPQIFLEQCKYVVKEKK